MTCDGRYVGLFDPARLSPAEDALSGAPFGRRAKHTCCIADGLTKTKLLVEDSLVSDVEEVELCRDCAASYEERRGSRGCVGCGARLAADLQIGGFEALGAHITQRCTACALQLAAAAVNSAAESAAAAQNDASQLRAEVKALRDGVDAAPPVAKPAVQTGPDGRAPRFDRNGRALGMCSANYLGRGGASARTGAPPLRRR